jgi:outer membrane protein OmpA-like peptidoglycan-associated protein
MDIYFSGINKKLQNRSIAAMLFILSIVFLCPGAARASSGPENRFTVFKADFDITPVTNKDEKLVKDFYINGGKDNGIARSTVLDVYREKVVRDTFQGKETKISILIGQIKVIKVFENVAITRITNLVYSEKTPVLQYRSVMIGDYAVPGKKKMVTRETRKTPKKMVTVEPRKTPKLYSIIPVTARSGDLSAPGISFPSNVLFAFDDWRLKPEALQAITEVMNIFNKSGDRKIVIEGHTCSLGENSYNLVLSKNRAQSVSDYLVNVKGIPADNVRIEYYGELFPVASNDNEMERVKNRRVDIRFLPLSKKERLLQSLVKNKSRAGTTD